MFTKSRNCSCMYNNINLMEQDALEMSCPNSSSCNNCGINQCECGYDEEAMSLPSNPMLAQSYVPFQNMNTTFIPEVGLRIGTIFPELVSPYVPGQSMDEMAYLEERNTIGKGCNR